LLEELKWNSGGVGALSLPAAASTTPERPT
jgi:hypothetical protein